MSNWTDTVLAFPLLPIKPKCLKVILHIGKRFTGHLIFLIMIIQYLHHKKEVSGLSVCFLLKNNYKKKL